MINSKNYSNDGTSKSLEQQYQDCINEGRIVQAISFLKGIAVTAKTSEQFKNLEILIVSSLLNGTFWENIDLQTKIGIKNICRATGCMIGFWITNPKGQEKIKGLFDLFNKGMGEKNMNTKETEQELGEFSSRLSNRDVIKNLSMDSSLSDPERNLLKEYLELSTNTSEIIEILNKNPENGKEA